MKADQQIKSFLGWVELACDDIGAFYETSKSNEVSEKHILLRIKKQQTFETYKLYALAPTELYEPSWMHIESTQNRLMKAHIELSPKRKLLGGNRGPILYKCVEQIFYENNLAITKTNEKMPYAGGIVDHIKYFRARFPHRPANRLNLYVDYIKNISTNKHSVDIRILDPKH